MNHGSLFSGIGGFDLAAEWMGWNNVFNCERDPWCRKLLQKRFPNAKSYGSIEDTDFTIHGGGVNILTGGDPCQPSSVAGERAGKSDVRFLWPQKRRVYNEIRPEFVVNENVPGTISNGILDEKIRNLEADGYTCWPPLVIPAGAAGAIHRRDRVWLVAYSMRTGRGKFNASTKPENEKKRNVRNSTVSVAEYGSIIWNPDQSEILRASYGIPDRLDRNRRISALGNAIAPQIAYQIFKAIEKFEDHD